MAGPTGCGLCGLESVDDAMKLPTTLMPAVELPSESVLIEARDLLPSLQRRYGGVRGNHCAAYFDLAGNCIAYKEDVGRHSALDKLIGYLARQHQTGAGFVLISSRCSHDLVTKAARSGLPVLVTLAQPTSLAVHSARQTGLALFSFQYRQLKRFA